MGFPMIRLVEEDWEALRSIARMLNAFARERAYGYLDRLANAYSAKAAESVIREALRDARSLRAQGEKIHIPTIDVVERFLRLVESDVSVCSKVVALALAFPPRRQEQEGGQGQGGDV